MNKGIGRLISILHRQSQIYINCSLKQYNITSAEYSFLLYLFRKDGASQDEMSSFMYIDKSATTRAILALEEKGYVVKSKDEIDKRINRIYLSDKAKKYMNEIRQRIWSWSEFIAEDIDDETTNLVISTLEKMVDKVETTNFRKQMEE